MDSAASRVRYWVCSMSLSRKKSITKVISASLSGHVSMAEVILSALSLLVNTEQSRFLAVSDAMNRVGSSWGRKQPMTIFTNKLSTSLAWARSVSTLSIVLEYCSS